MSLLHEPWGESVASALPAAHCSSISLAGLLIGPYGKIAFSGLLAVWSRWL